MSSSLRVFGLSILGYALIVGPLPSWPQSAEYRPAIPKTWDEAALAEWATPLAGLNLRPAHMSSKEYYSLPVDNLKTYPVYLPGREPPGYWEILNRIGPQPIIEPEKLKTVTDWVEAGRRVFEEADHLHLRTLDPKFVDAVRRGESIFPDPDGIATNLRWVPTKDGIALSFPNCANCHLLTLKEGNPHSRRSDVRYCPAGDRTDGANAHHAGSICQTLRTRRNSLPYGLRASWHVVVPGIRRPLEAG
jgi:hypothetical protein